MSGSVPSKSAQSLPHLGADVTPAMGADSGHFDPALTRLAEGETAFRCYRYALRLTPAQSQALARASGQARRIWNELCALLAWAENEQRHGRREALLHAYGKLLGEKKRAGKAIAKAQRLMEQHGLPDLGRWTNPQVAVLFRKFEESPEADLHSLLEDLALLDDADDGSPRQ